MNTQSASNGSNASHTAAVAGKKDAAYFQYFPGNYRWSSGMINMMGVAPYGGSDISELHRIGLMLKDKAGADDQAWFDACVTMGDRIRLQAEGFDAKGYRHSAAHSYLRACNYYQFGERFLTPKTPQSDAAYQTAMDCFKRHLALGDITGEVVEVPYDNGKSMPAYFIHAQNPRSERTPCMVFFGGLDITKEIQFTRGVPDLIKRGISCLVIDGPGTGEAVRFREQFLRHDYEVPGSACIDFLEQRADVDPQRIGIVAMSLGGYYAPRAAAFDHRWACCIAWGAQWDYHAIWKKRIDAALKASMSVPGHHILWIFGVQTYEEALEKLLPFKLDGVVQKMTCPFLITHGSEDEQVTMADAKKLLDACGSKDKTLRVYTAEEGGAQHCQRDYLPLVVADMWNWAGDRLFA
jgi:dienelactone hydrolase